MPKARQGITVATAVLVVMILTAGLIAGILVLNHSASTSHVSNRLSAKQNIPPQNQNIQHYVGGTGCQNLTLSGLQLMNGDLTRLAFLMKTGTTASVCVTYFVSPPVHSAETIDFQNYANVFAVTATRVSGGGIGYSYSKTQSPYVTIVANPITVSIEPNSTTANVTVIYTITAANQASGFYSLNFYNNCPSFLPFAVGYGTSQVNASDYEGFFMPSSCVGDLFLSSGSVTGYGGLGTTWITATHY